MKHASLILLLAFMGYYSEAQLTMPVQGGSTKAMVYERVGLTDVTVNYGRPALRGREGKIWGELVKVGYEDNSASSYGTAKMMPWRAGANENTTIEFSTDVMIEHKRLPAGKYGFFIAYDPNEATIIFSKNSSSWGAFFYDEHDDALRVKIHPAKMASTQERLTYNFSDQTDSTAILNLSWEKMNFPILISTELYKLQMETIAKELKTDKAFGAMFYFQAGQYMADHNTDPEQALSYLNIAAQAMPSFNVLSTKVKLLEKIGRQEEADKTMKTAIENSVNPFGVHFYARQLLKDNKNQKAFDVFKMNYAHFPDVYTTNVGMARGYSAIGKYKDALKHAQKALPQAPDDTNKQSVEKMIQMLKEGKDVNGS